MGHRIAVMSEGKLQQVAAPEALYARPANAFVAHFLGSPGMNLVEGMLVESGAPAAGAESSRGALSVAFPGASVPLPAAVGDAVRGSGPEVVLGLRPEALHLSEEGAISATVVIVELLGAETHVICHTETGATRHCAPERLGRQAEDRRGRAHRGRPRPRRVPPVRRGRRDPAGRHGVTAVTTAPAPEPASGADDGAPASVRGGHRRRCARDAASRPCWPTC